MTPKETLAQAMIDLGITVESVFVPWSKSRHAKSNPKLADRSLNWKVTVKRNGREILTEDYTAGIGNAPSYQHGRITLETERALIHETEHGTKARPLASLDTVVGGKPISADPCDVMYSLVSDGGAIDYPNFEAWANEFGYDVDSRKAEACYRACLETGIKLRAACGDDGFRKLQESCYGY